MYYTNVRLNRIKDTEVGMLVGHAHKGTVI